MTLSPQRLFESVVDLFLPRRCACCGAAGGWLCDRCAAGLQQLAAGCARCGRPGALAGDCPECRGRGLAFGQAAAAFAYAGPARRLVTTCKFRGLRSIAGEMAGLAAPRFVSFAGATGAHVVTCVPPHRDHLLQRGFNQAESLARGLAGAAGLPFARLLARSREGRAQAGLTVPGRVANARGAFATLPGVNASEKLKRVVIADDVYTTGETLNSCAEALLRTGFEPVVFTFARAVRTPSQRLSPPARHSVRPVRGPFHADHRREERRP